MRDFIENARTLAIQCIEDGEQILVTEEDTLSTQLTS